MPTKIATLGRERSIATLARRIYQIEGTGTNEMLRRAQAALLAKNPRLATASGFRSGDKIVVPAVAGLRMTKEVTTSAAKGEGLNKETSLRLQALGSRVEDDFRRGSDQRQETLKLLGDRAFVKEARAALPKSSKHIAEANDRLKREEEEAKEVHDRLQNVVSSALEGIEKLDALTRKTGLGTLKR